MKESEMQRMEEVLGIRQTNLFNVHEDAKTVAGGGGMISVSPQEPSPTTALAISSTGSTEIMPLGATKEDIEKVRANLFALIQKGNESIEGILSVAQSTDSPRAYEVLANLMKTALETNQAIIKMHMDVAPQNQQPGSGQTNIEQAVFIGTGAELLEAIEQKAKRALEIIHPKRELIEEPKSVPNRKPKSPSRKPLE